MHGFRVKCFAPLFRIDWALMTYLGFFDPANLLLAGQHRQQLLDALLVDDGAVHLHHGLFDDPEQVLLIASAKTFDAEPKNVKHLHISKH